MKNQNYTNSSLRNEQLLKLNSARLENKAMFVGKFERELLSGELWSLWQKTKFPDHLQFLVDEEQGKRDIWEYQSQELDDQPSHQSFNDDSSQSTKT